MARYSDGWSLAATYLNAVDLPDPISPVKSATAPASPHSRNAVERIVYHRSQRSLWGSDRLRWLPFSYRRRCGSSCSSVIPLSPEASAFVRPWRIRRLYLQVVVPVSLCPAVRGQIDGNEESIGLSLEEDFRLLRLFGMEQEGHLFPYQGNGSLKDLSVQADGPVFGHLSPCGLAKMVLEIVRSGSETLHLRGKSGKGSLSRRRVFSLVVDLAQPQIKGLIEVMKGRSSEAGEKLGPHRTKESLDLPLSLRLVGPCVYEGD